MSKSFVLGIDAGGTSFKAGLVSEDYEVLPSSFSKFPIEDNKDSILNCYLKIVQTAQNEISKIGGTLIGIGVSTPGPFDYENATSHMRHKLQGIYGLNLRNALYQKGVPTAIPIRFLHDGLSFLLGEYIIGSVKAYQNIASVTLGTGISISLMKNGVLCKNARGDTAFSIYNNPFHGGTVEDFLSRRGIIRLYKELSGTDTNVDVLDLELLATNHHDPFALDTFALVGTYLAESIRSIILEQKVECIILGGQISKAYPLMEKMIREGLCDIPFLKNIMRGNRLDFSPLVGVASLLFEREETSNESVINYCHQL